MAAPLLAALSACTATESPSGTTASAAAVAAVQDPLTAVDDSSSSDFVGVHLPPVLHEQGVGSRSFSVNRPSGARSIRYYVACAPDSHFSVTMGSADGFYAGPCASRFENTGEIPLRGGSGSVTVTVDVPGGVHYWILGLPLAAPTAGS